MRLRTADNLATGVLWSVRDPWIAEGVLGGDLVVPTGWRTMGSVHGFYFLFAAISLKGLKGDSAIKLFARANLSSSPRDPEMREP
ncbi:hypothetical protein O6P43_035467 [Quillaja saponaria]|uniref:Uncharacterized protein n=1 Tax=Quillaja saponaria TaxID=32244 RepID=A0AAD7P490_QUISA|nr:hypothetical protein O6P43_035467 [Quillaja saponaria]